MHVRGIDSKYPSVVRAIDERIGEYRQASKELGQEQERYYVLASDHGVVNVTKNFDIGDYLKVSTLTALSIVLSALW